MAIVTGADRSVGRRIAAWRWRTPGERLAVVRAQRLHCQPMGASTMHSVQMGRSQDRHNELAMRSGCS
jgi:hypothetical protein